MNPKARILLLLFVQLVVSICASAQFDQKASAKVEAGGPTKTFNRIPGELYYTTKGIVSVKANYWKMYFKRFNAKTLEEKVSRKLKFGQFSFYEGSFYANDKLFILFSTGVSDGKEEVYCGEIDMETGKWKGKPHMILATSDRILGSNGRTKKGVLPEDKFNVGKSPDGSKLVVKYILKDEINKDTGEYSVYGFGVFDSDMQLMWQDEITLTVADENVGVYGSEVDNEGNLRMLTMAIEPDPANPPKLLLHPNVFKKPVNGKLKSEEAFSIFPYRFVHSISSTETPEGDMIYSGYCTNHKKNYTAQGVFFARVDDEGNLVNQHTTPIALELINQYTSAGERAKNRELDSLREGGLDGLMVKRIKALDDGGSISIGHQRTTMAELTSGAKYFLAETMLVTRFDAEGHVLWMKKIPKKQASDHSDELTFYHTYLDGSHYIIYMDQAENLDLKTDETPKRFSHRTFGFSSGNLVAYVIKDKSGEVQKMNIFDLSNIGGYSLKRIFPVNITERDRSIFLEANMTMTKDVLIKITPNRY